MIGKKDTNKDNEELWTAFYPRRNIIDEGQAMLYPVSEEYLKAGRTRGRLVFSLVAIITCGSIFWFLAHSQRRVSYVSIVGLLCLGILVIVVANALANWMLKQSATILTCSELLIHLASFTRLRFSTESPLLLCKSKDGRYWILRSGKKKRKKKVMTRAFPQLERFLRDSGMFEVNESNWPISGDQVVI